MSAIRQCSITARKISVRTMLLQRPAAMMSQLAACNQLNQQNWNLIPVQQYRGFKNFGHKPEKMATVTKFWYLLVGTSMVACYLDWKA